ncbi:MAG: Thiosulfate sulfurtransferase GlpE [Ignavibacteriaceae bacterium]|nr:Thiosulfate sulfurtransferase GlpE [Ignavibacteriaceae bacterium]
MKTLHKYLFLFIIPMLFITACSEDSTTNPPAPTVNEAELLVQYIENDGDFINTLAPAMITADEVRTYQLTKPDKIHIIDIRPATNFAKGHIEGSVNKPLTEVLNYMKSITPANYEKIAFVCFSGQTAGYAVSLLRLAGYNNVFDLKFGMSAWNDSVENVWKPNVGNNYTNFVTDVTAKAAAGALPTLSTGKTTGKEILEARIAQLLSAADPFGDIKISWQTVTANLSNYYIINYWPQAHYDMGHLPGAIQYTPKVDLKLSTNLKTLPTNKTIALYCYTGQTSAQVVTYLKLLGYDAKSLLYGVSTMNYNLLTTNNLTTWKDSECKYYPVVK